VQAVKRHVAAIVVIAAGLAGPALAAAPASAGNSTSTVGCSTGDSCTVMLQNMIKWGGPNYSAGANNMVVDIQPPPCLWEPIGDGTTGSQAITNQWGTDPSKAPTAYSINLSVKQAAGYEKNPPPPPGQWYELPVNPAAGTAGAQQCLQLPLYDFVPPGQAPLGITVPPQTLAQLALAKVAIPAAGKMYFNPAGPRTFINLPTFVRVTLGGAGGGPGGYETDPATNMPYVTVTATLGANTVTVWAVASHLHISASGGSSFTPDTNNCGYLGSQEMTTPQAAHVGVGSPIDCGLTFHSPATWNVTASMTWRTCWAQAPTGPPPAGNCAPVPGAQLNPVNWTGQIRADEIQSVNNG
jgi:hypothetical protein